MDETTYVEKDGLNWTVTRGRAPTMSQLEDGLQQVKSLYKAKFGEDVDSTPTMSQLEDQLQQVKSLYKAKFGEDVDDDDDEDEDVDETKYVEKDGINWVVTHGHAPTMSQLEDGLQQVKSLYKAKFGEDVDDEEEDEFTWVVTRGCAPTMSQLEDHLEQVKSLYKVKFGKDVHDVDDVDEEEKAGGCIIS